jgi:hypothetical protein
MRPNLALSICHVPAPRGWLLPQDVEAPRWSQIQTTDSDAEFVCFWPTELWRSSPGRAKGLSCDYSRPRNDTEVSNPANQSAMPTPKSGKRPSRVGQVCSGGFCRMCFVKCIKQSHWKIRFLHKMISNVGFTFHLWPSELWKWLLISKLLRHKHVPRGAWMPTPTIGVQAEKRRKREKKKATWLQPIWINVISSRNFSKVICLVLHQKYGAFEEGRCFAPHFGHQSRVCLPGTRSRSRASCGTRRKQTTFPRQIFSTD